MSTARECPIASREYDHRNPSRHTREDCEAVVGKPATLTLTGRIVAVRSSDAGSFVSFEIDERFGFGDFKLALDLDAFTVGEAE